MSEEKNQNSFTKILAQRKPAELDFLTPEQLKVLDGERAKLENTQKFIKSVVNHDDFDNTINKAIFDGRIYSPSQYANLSAKFRALDERDSERIDITETLVSKSGEKIIMGIGLQDALGLLTDGVMSKDELNELEVALKQTMVPDPEVERVVASMNKEGQVFLQRGIFIPLKGLLEESLGKKLIVASENRPSSTEPEGAMPTNPPPPTPAIEAPTPVVETPKTVHPVELPISFIEYLKNNDKEYDRVEHEVMNDPQFQEFFANLKSHFAYYKTLTAEKMSWEVIVRPQLWVKLSPRTRAWVQNIVVRNQDDYLQKVEQIAAASHAGQLEELKRSITK